MAGGTKDGSEAQVLAAPAEDPGAGPSTHNNLPLLFQGI